MGMRSRYFSLAGEGLGRGKSFSPFFRFFAFHPLPNPHFLSTTRMEGVKAMDEIKIKKMPRTRQNGSSGGRSYPFEHPEKVLQADHIAPATKFLWYVSKDPSGFRATWIWNEDAAELARFLIEVPAKRNLLREFGGYDEEADISEISFDEAIAYCFAKSLGNRAIDLRLFANLATGEASLLDAARKGDDLNKASGHLMDATSHFYYSLSWQFFENEEEALQMAKTHPAFNERELPETAFRDDSSL
jgi:hypothetical protein